MPQAALLLPEDAREITARFSRIVEWPPGAIRLILRDEERELASAQTEGGPLLGRLGPVTEHVLAFESRREIRDARGVVVRVEPGIFAGSLIIAEIESGLPLTSDITITWR